jgi:O-methyltransferase involved in polyketide biosynthesis
LQDGLRASSLDFSQPTFFSCLGVMVYLTREAVNAIFTLVAGFPADSEIVFTFSTPDAAVSNWANKVKRLGEPWRTHFEPDALVSDLHALGFSQISLLTADEAEQIYFQGRNDGLHAPHNTNIAAAVVGAACGRCR